MNPGRPDRVLVERHLLALDVAVQTLRTYQGRPREALSRQRTELWAVEHGLQLCAQNVLDVATHLAASAGRDVPDYATAMDHLADLGILPVEFAKRLRALAGFRNVIVHAYLDVDVVHVLMGWERSGFSVYGEQVVLWDEEERLDRLLRYVTRAPMAFGVVEETEEGKVRVRTPVDPRTGERDVVLDPVAVRWRARDYESRPSQHA